MSTRYSSHVIEPRGVELEPVEVTWGILVPTVVIAALWILVPFVFLGLTRILLLGALFTGGSIPFDDFWLTSSGLRRLPVYALGSLGLFSGLWAGILIPRRRLRERRELRRVVVVALAVGVIAELLFLWEFVTDRLPVTVEWLMVWTFGLLPPLWAAGRIGYALSIRRSDGSRGGA